MSGHGITEHEATAGASEGALPRRRSFAHPWQVTPSWSSPSTGSGRWVATIKAGFVNGVAPIFRTSIDEQEKHDRDFGINPLTGLPYFSSFVFQTAAEKVAAQFRPLDIPLYLGPAIPLEHVRALGADGAADSEVPPFFQVRGVQSIGDDPVDPREVRRLRAIDLILHQPRLALTSTIDIADGLFSGTSIVRQVLSVQAPEANDALRVYAGLFAAPLDVVDPLAEQYEEPAWDELRIATVYLLSLPGAAAGSEPNATWTAYVQHYKSDEDPGLCWNLMWAPAPILDAPDTHTDRPFIIPLAGGVAQPIVSTILASGEDLNQQALNMIKGHSLAGTFWTPTGGGHDAKFPPDGPGPATTGGLNKAARIGEQARAETLRKRVLKAAQTTLDLPFPYSAIGFDPTRISSFS